MTIRQTDDWYDWLIVERGDPPLVLSIPHSGTHLPDGIESRLASDWIALKDTDWYVDQLYSFAQGLGATVIRTLVSRTVIDVNRDPEGRSLYPGQATTELCPTTTFDGEALYRTGARLPDEQEIATRRLKYYTPYHTAIGNEIARLRRKHGKVALYDAHSIRSVVPRLFEGTLPVFNLGTNTARSCAPELRHTLEAICGSSGLPTVVDGRFKGGYITRHYGQPDAGVHAVQLELAMRGYLDEPAGVLDGRNWPPAYDAGRAARLIATLREVVSACVSFAKAGRATRRRRR